MQAVAQTILRGARLEVLLQRDRLGLDQEMEFLTEEFQDGRAQEVDAIRDILERLAGDDKVLDRVRKTGAKCAGAQSHINSPFAETF